jgi:CRISPR-associated exonuclease Cas4
MKFRIEDITGTMVNYYFSCERQLWLFSRYIKMEETSDLVLMGKIIHEKSYKRKKKELIIDGIKLDFIEKKKGSLIIHEVKKAKSNPEAHKYQLLYYLYYLNKKGITANGEINYPEQKRSEHFTWDDKYKDEIEKILEKILIVINKECVPSPVKSKLCTKCSYNDFCWS